MGTSAETFLPAPVTRAPGRKSDVWLELSAEQMARIDAPTVEKRAIGSTDVGRDRMRFCLGAIYIIDGGQGCAW